MSPTTSEGDEHGRGIDALADLRGYGDPLGITIESAKRLAMRHRWPRRPGNDGRALVAVPEERIAQAATGNRADDDRGMKPVTSPMLSPVAPLMTAGAMLDV